jgi:hypothetical protein
MASISASLVLSSITATPRAMAPRAFMPNSVAELSGPYTLGVTITTRSTCSALCSALISSGEAGSGV